MQHHVFEVIPRTVRSHEVGQHVDDPRATSDLVIGDPAPFENFSCGSRRAGRQRCYFAAHASIAQESSSNGIAQQISLGNFLPMAEVDLVLEHRPLVVL